MGGWRGWEDVNSVEDITGGSAAERAGGGCHRKVPAGAGIRRDPPKGLLRGDRGTRRGAQRFIVTADRQLVEHALARNTNTGGTFFQSKREALRWISLLGESDRGEIRNLRRQVSFALQCTNAAGLKETVTRYVADFVYEELWEHPHLEGERKWLSVVEDVKPRGGLREDSYKLKKRWFEAQYGMTIRETH